MEGFFSLTTLSMAAFPVLREGRLPHWNFRGLLDVYSRYGLRTRLRHLRDVFASKGWSQSFPPRLLRLLPDGAIVIRVGFAPTEDCAFHGAPKRLPPDVTDHGDARKIMEPLKIPSFVVMLNLPKHQTTKGECRGVSKLR